MWIIISSMILSIINCDFYICMNKRSEIRLFDWKFSSCTCLNVQKKCLRTHYLGLFTLGFDIASNSTISLSSVFIPSTYVLLCNLITQISILESWSSVMPTISSLSLKLCCIKWPIRFLEVATQPKPRNNYVCLLYRSHYSHLLKVLLKANSQYLVSGFVHEFQINVDDPDDASISS